MRNGRRQLLDHVKNFYLANFSKDLNDQKANAKVSNLLSYHRGTGAELLGRNAQTRPT
jgi:hypothetical protein